MITVHTHESVHPSDGRRWEGRISKKLELSLVGNRKDSYYKPWIRGDAVKLKGCPQKEMKILLEKVSIVFLLHFCDRLGFIFVLLSTQTIPIERTNFPV